MRPKKAAHRRRDKSIKSRHADSGVARENRYEARQRRAEWRAVRQTLIQR